MVFTHVKDGKETDPAAKVFSKLAWDHYIKNPPKKICDQFFPPGVTAETVDVGIECSHIIGHHDDAGLVYQNSKQLPQLDGWFDIKFKFCPLCGEKLDDNRPETNP